MGETEIDLKNMPPRYSATVLALVMVACVMFDIGDGTLALLPDYITRPDLSE